MTADPRRAPLDDLSAWLEETLANAKDAPEGPWEWSDCFDPEHESCGLLQVRVPSAMAWDRAGWQYITIGDMEWVERGHMCLARHIARCDPQTVTRLLAVVVEVNRVIDAYLDDNLTDREFSVFFDALLTERDNLREHVTGGQR